MHMSNIHFICLFNHAYVTIFQFRYKLYDTFLWKETINLKYNDVSVAISDECIYVQTTNVFLNKDKDLKNKSMDEDNLSRHV